MMGELFLSMDSVNYMSSTESHGLALILWTLLFQLNALVELPSVRRLQLAVATKNIYP